MANSNLYKVVFTEGGDTKRHTTYVELTSLQAKEYRRNVAEMHGWNVISLKRAIGAGIARKFGKKLYAH